jgi:hypothetical protein
MIGFSWSESPTQNLHDSMLLRQRGDAAKHNQKQDPGAAANDEWKKNGENGTSGGCLMRTRKADAIYDQRPNTGNQSATDRNDLQRTGRAVGKCQDAKGGLERFVCATHDHQTKMNNRRSDKQPDHNEYRDKDDERNRANADSS